MTALETSNNQGVGSSLVNELAGNKYENTTVSNSSSVHIGNVLQTHYHGTERSVQECHRALKTSSYEAHKDRNPSRVEDTCKWVLQHPQFHDWRRNEHHALLWISADPGCGKSVLCKSLVDQDLRAGGEETICYFFFKDNEEQDRVHLALCAILHQLFIQQPRLVSHALPAWEANGGKLPTEIRELWRILQSAVADENVKPVICVLDALDECRRDDLRLLTKLLCNLQATRSQNNNGCNLRFLVTSRPYQSVEQEFWEVTLSWPQIRLRGEVENEQIHQEINLVIKKRVQELAQMFDLSEEVRSRLETQLLDMNHRTYLWLHLAIDEIRQTYADSLYPNEVTIESIPAFVEDAYERLLHNITAAQRPIARQVLLIIVGARRPLSVKEMACALGAAKAHQQEKPLLAIPNEQHLRNQIRHWCGLFVFIQHDKLLLIHQTAKEFLLCQESASVLVKTDLWRSSLPILDVEIEMANICTTYLILTHTQRDGQLETTARMAVQRWSSFHGREIKGQTDEFWNYCAEHWVSHSQDEVVFNDLKLLDKAFLLCEVERLRSCWTEIFWQIKAKRLYRKPSKFEPLHAVVITGLESFLKIFLEKRQVDLDAFDSQKETALSLAVMQEYLNIARLLLEAGANPRIKTGTPRKAPLSTAAVRGNQEMVKLLLEAGADVNARSGSPGDTPLWTAVHQGDQQIVKILLKAGADVNAYPGSQGITPLWTAVHQGDQQMVRVLLEAGADVNPQPGSREITPLWTAAYHGDQQMLKILLEAGADPNARSGFRDDTPLRISVAQQDHQIVRILLKAGANANPQSGSRGNTPLWRAVYHSDQQIVEILLEAGADVSAHPGLGITLFAAAKYGHLQVFQMLLEADADVNALEGFLGDVLDAVQRRGYELVQNKLRSWLSTEQLCRYEVHKALLADNHKRVTQTLFCENPEIETEEDAHSYALQVASKSSNKEIVHALLKENPEDYYPPYLGAARKDRGERWAKAEEINKFAEQILLDTDEGPHDEHRASRDAFLAALLWRERRMVQLLRKAGAEIPPPP